MTVKFLSQALARCWQPSQLWGTSLLAIAITLGSASTSTLTSAQAATLNWYDLWDTDSTESSRTFRNVDGSGIDINVEYSTNMYWSKQNEGRLNLYDNGASQKNALNDSHPLDQYDGILRLTNDRNKNPESVFLKLTFSEAVNLDEFWVGSLSTIGNAREWVSVSAYGTDEVSLGDLDSYADQRVAATKYDTYDNFFGNKAGDYTAKADKASLVSLDADTSDKVYTTAGVGNQSNQDYGRVFFEYSDEAVRSLVIEHFTTAKNNGNKASTKYTSVAVSPNIFFTKTDDSTAVPEPTALLGLLAFGGLATKTVKRQAAQSIS
ncbi:MAG: hypothetical protein WA783_16480 [Phormidesmis sp.]